MRSQNAALDQLAQQSATNVQLPGPPDRGGGGNHGPQGQGRGRAGARADRPRRGRGTKQGGRRADRRHRRSSTTNFRPPSPASRARCPPRQGRSTPRSLAEITSAPGKLLREAGPSARPRRRRPGRGTSRGSKGAASGPGPSVRSTTPPGTAVGVAACRNRPPAASITSRLRLAARRRPGTIDFYGHGRLHAYRHRLSAAPAAPRSTRPRPARCGLAGWVNDGGGNNVTISHGVVQRQRADHELLPHVLRRGLAGPARQPGPAHRRTSAPPATPPAATLHFETWLNGRAVDPMDLL